MTTSDSKIIYFYGIGRRKTAVARVRVYEGDDKNTINGMEKNLSELSLSPLKLVGKSGSCYVSIRLNGGGYSAQAEAIRLGIARALVKMNNEYRPALKKAGYLCRDSREVERKKPGLKKARRAPQWSKR